MKLLGFSKLLGVLVALGAVAPGCKDDPPAPPVAESGKTAKKPVKDPSRAQQPKASPQANKEFFVDACVMGSWGLRLTRDTYLASLGGKEPSAELLPSFGEFPELDLNPKSATAPATSTSAATSAAPSAASAVPATSAKPTAAPATAAASAPPAPKASTAPATSGTVAAGSATAGPGHDPMADRIKARAGQIPYARYFNRCRSAAGVQGAEDATLDAALKDYATYLESLNKVLNPASAYYRNRQFEKDDFAKGKEFHKQLVTQFGELDAKLDAVMAAYTTWQKGLKPAPDKLDAAGDITLGAVTEARAMALAFLAKEPDDAAIKASLDKLRTAADKLVEEQKNPTSQFAKRVAPRLQAFVRIASEVEQKLADKKLEPVDRYTVTAAFTSLVEIKNQALLSHLTQMGAKVDPHGGPGGPMRGPIPRVQPPGGPKPAEAEDKPGEEEAK
ncbi:MAG: DUF3829 domain-containing protein [Polyangiaceae bacterium]|nr:DUF3829 domain-containing protein [Polyangiaceae bacterium]